MRTAAVIVTAVF